MGLAVDHPLCYITRRGGVSESLHLCLDIPRNTDFLARDYHPGS